MKAYNSEIGNCETAIFCILASMQQYKIDNHLRESANNTFPKYTPVSNIGCSSIVDSIKSLLRETNEDDNLFDLISKQCNHKAYKQEETDNLKFVFDSLGFNCKENVYLIWDEKEIDKMSTKSLLKHWPNIWYPPSDDALILYCTASKKFLLIHHADIVYYN